MTDPPLAFRVGHGYDAHRLTSGRKLILGGVVVEHISGLEGHSDADVLAHAIIDALFGAMALGDLGHHFPPGDERFRDANSIELLRRAVALVADAGGRPAQVDATLHLERPKIAEHLPAMRANLAEALGLSVARVSIKATTFEGMGFVGREEGAAASAVVVVATGGV